MTGSTREKTYGSVYLKRAYESNTPDQQREVYDEWASLYDKEILGIHGYVAPRLAAATLLQCTGGHPGRVLDAGCGTGLVGKEIGGGDIHGVDVSPGMLKQAEETGAYASLQTMDLTRDLPLQDAEFDAVTCVGTFTHGHVGPSAIPELVRVTRPTGFVVATVLEDMWEEDGFASQVADLESCGTCEVISKNVVPYRQAAGVNSLMLVLRRL